MIALGPLSIYYMKKFKIPWRGEGAVYTSEKMIFKFFSSNLLLTFDKVVLEDIKPK